MTEPIKVVEHLGYTIKVFIDDDPPNPRKEFDHLGKILYVSSRYELGDEKVDTEVIEDILRREDVISLPVYAFIHGSVSLSTASFSCKWDSGQSGIIYCELDAAKDEYPELSEDALKERVFERFKAEVEEYSKYLNGEVYGFVMTEPTGIHENSCWGFYSTEDCIEDAKSFAEHTGVPKICMTFEGKPTCTGPGDASCGGR